MRAPTFRESHRARLRADLLAAARELTIERGWPGVRMADVAAVAGVSRQTVYNEFSSRAGLAEALAAAEVARFVAAMRDDFFAAGADAREAVRTAALRVMREIGGNPVVHDRDLFSYPATGSRLVLDAAGAVIREWAATFRPDCPVESVQLAAESVVRLTVSHLALPLASPSATASALAEVFVRLLG
jgi:AcrR family transcriptional regulator